MAIRFRALLAVAAFVPVTLASGCAASHGATAPAGRAASAARAASATSAELPRGPGSAPVRLAETGSTLLYRLFGEWATAYHARFPGVSITTGSTGSGAGIQGASTGTADIGASDAFLSAGNLVQNPRLLNIPLAISAQQVNYYLPGLRPSDAHVNLTGPVLAQMYQGAITNWRAAAIEQINPGVTFPNLPVVPLHRADSSGDTFLFSSYLSTTDPSWNSAYGYGTTVAWPAAPDATAEDGNQGMVTGCVAHPGCVAYIGISFLAQASGDGLGYAALRNAARQFVTPTGPSMLAAVRTFVPATPPNETISMVNGPAQDGYPIVNYEYAVVSDRQPAAKARALKAFLHWVVTAGNAAGFLSSVDFQPLPAAIVTLADAQIASIR